MLKLRLFIILILVFDLSFAKDFDDYSSRNLSNKTVEAIEDKALSLLNEIRPNKAKRFFLYNLAGRELYFYGHYKKAKKYYKMAIGVPLSEDKIEAYLNIMAINHFIKSKDLEKDFLDAKSYLIRSSHKNNKSIKEYFLSYENAFIKNKKKGKLKDFYSGFFGSLNRDTDIKREVILRNYQKALTLTNFQNLSLSSINERIRYDVLNTLVYKRKSSELLCLKDLKKYPKSLTFTMEICRYLDAYIKNKIEEKKRIKQIVERTSRESHSYLYLAKALKDLKW